MSNPLKKTMVYLGLADEEEVYEEPAPQPRARTSEKVVDKPAAPVTPIHRPAVVRQPAPAAINEILTVHLKQYREDVKAAAALLAVGDRPAPKDVDAAEMAAWVSVSRVLLNLHETITRN